MTDTSINPDEPVESDTDKAKDKSTGGARQGSTDAGDADPTADPTEESGAGYGNHARPSDSDDQES